MYTTCCWSVDTTCPIVNPVDAAKLAVDSDDTEDDEVPRISLAEMLDDLHIAGDATGGEGAPMME